jgi:hypothetical protein
MLQIHAILFWILEEGCSGCDLIHCGTIIENGPLLFLKFHKT